MQDDAAANPDHGGGADGAENCQEYGHPAHEGASDPPAHTGKNRGTVVAGKGQTEIEVTLPPGTYKLTAQFANGAHLSYGPAMSQTIKVTVR